jgi:DNA-binding IclR family transcriptional regulator
MKEPTEKQGRNGIQVIARAADILRALKADQTGRSLGQIADAVALPRSTVQRIVAALMTEQLVIANASGGGLRLGPEVNALAQATRYNIVETCRLFLTELAQATGETADLSVMRGAGMIFLDQVPGTHRLRTVSAVGDVFPLTATANGMACLSHIAEDKAQNLILSEWDRRGMSGNLSAIQSQLATIRRDRLAYDQDAHTKGISAIGFAFTDQVHDVLAISVPMPSTRFAEKRAIVETALRKTAVQLDKLMRT